ncbi:acyltransferase family protein [Jeotgalibacillus sp. JSM ZJ347]|uniref:acyltransferase family protein n=1 Tax=Jeotgalibacillus sp. JSM ZJ347 TaxID=3342117 RepID=UPI0035A88F50
MQEVKPRKLREELEGLRAVAAILVAIYHIWFNRVSGGVDVFFVVSGFLITTSLLSMYRRNGRILYFSYVVKLLKRLLPTAWLIGIATFVISFVVMPLYTRQQVLDEFLASSFYFQNWRLAIDSVDYLASNYAASPYQHFWALSIQFQFYLIWLLLFFVGITLLKIFKKADFKRLLLIVIGLVIVSSFTYSVYLTEVNQPVAYYHTFTRVWEFGLGGILALTIHKIRVLKPLAWVFGWVGLIALLSGGIIFQVSDVFPGYAALWPVLAAVLMIVAGNEAKHFSAYSVLSWKPLVKFGGISYAFYLWHWPMLIFYYAYFEVESVSVLHGIAVMAVSALLAYLTIQFVEKPIRTSAFHLKRTAVVIAVLALSIVSAAQVYESQALVQEEIDISDSYDPDNPHPGATVKLFDGGLDSIADFEEPFLPTLDNAYQDRADIYPDRCLLGKGTVGVRICEYGETEEYENTVALVGGSHSAHWLPALQEFADEENILIKTYIKGGCRFTTDILTDLKECDEWFANVQDQLVEDDPDLIFAVADVGLRVDMYDEVPEGFINAWEFFEERDMPLFLMEDTPWFEKSVLRCVEKNPDHPESCNQPVDQILRDPTPVNKLDRVPENVTFLNVNDYFCDDETCHAVIGNVLTYFDNNHITATYARTLGPVIKPHVMRVLENRE